MSANFLVIVASHGSLAITNHCLLQETIQSMVHKMVLHIQTCIERKLMQILDHQNR